MTEVDQYSSLELSHLVDQINSLNTARVQIASFLGTANIFTLGTAFTTSMAGLFLGGAAVMALAALIDLQLRALVFTNTTRGIVLQRRLSGGQPDTFLQTQPLWLTHKAIGFADEPDDAARAASLRRLPILRTAGKAIVIMSTIVTVEAALTLLALTKSFSLF